MFYLWRRNVITGNMVCCKIVKKEDIEEKALKKEIRQFCKSKLENYKVPSKFIFVNEIGYSKRFKKALK